MKRLLVILAATAMAACSQPSNNPTPHPDAGGGGDAGADAGSGGKLADSLPTWQSGQQIEVTNVVVTASNAPTTGAAKFYIQDPNGGPNTGVLVYRAKGSSNTDPLPNRGDVLHIVGTTDIYGGERELDCGASKAACTLQWQVLSSGATLPAADSKASGDLYDSLSNTASDSEQGSRVALNDGPWVVVNDNPPSQQIPTGDGGTFAGGFVVGPQSDSANTAKQVMVITPFYKTLKSGGCEPNDAGAYAKNGSVFSTLGGIYDVYSEYPDGGNKPIRAGNQISPGGCDEFSHN